MARFAAIAPTTTGIEYLRPCALTTFVNRNALRCASSMPPTNCQRTSACSSASLSIGSSIVSSSPCAFSASRCACRSGYGRVESVIWGSLVRTCEIILRADSNIECVCDPGGNPLKAASFEYARASSVAEACEMLRQDGADIKLIAGGQSLVPMMAMRLTRPARLIDINEIGALKFISIDNDVARIGACTRQCVVARNDALAARVPLLRKALAWVGHVQTRNRGTIGGSLAHADPAAELPLVAQVLEARMQIRSAAGARTLNASEFFVGPLTTALEPHECLEEIHWPVWNGRSGSAFTEVSRRHGDFAIIEACAQIELDKDGRCTRASFGLGGGGTIPLAFPKLSARLAGTRIEDKIVTDVAHNAAAELDPGSDLHASAAYRKHLAAVLAARVIRAAHEDARSRP